MENFFNEISFELMFVLAINFFLIFILFIFCISNRMKYKKLKNKYNRFMNGLSDRNMEELLEECISRVNKVGDKNKEIENHVTYLERVLRQCTQKIGIVRFNAFDNVGSDLSFAIAMLDDNDSGLVLSSIYSRDSSSTYAKPIADGKSRYTLSAEEIQAIDIAKKTHRENIL